MVRKLFIYLILAVGILPWSWAAGRRVTVIKSRELAPYNLAAQGLARTLEAWDPNVRIQELVLPWPEGQGRAFLESVRDGRPDLIVTVGTQATQMVSQAVSDIPVIFSLVLTHGDPSSGVAPRRSNVTGAAMDIPIPVQFTRLLEVIPDLRRVGVIFNPDESGEVIEVARAAAGSMGLELVEISVNSETQVMEAMGRIKGKVDVLWSVADSTVFTPRSVDGILLTTLRESIPFVGLSPSFVKAGALLSFSCDYEDVGIQAGEMAVEVLSGTDPARLSIVYPRRIGLFLNLNTARTIHLDISEQVKAEAQIHFTP